MAVSDEVKFGLAAGVLSVARQGLAIRDPDGEPSADDMIDLFAIATAAVIENDDRLDTPELRAKAVEMMSRRLADRIAVVSACRGPAGDSYFEQAMAGAPAATTRH